MDEGVLQAATPGGGLHRGRYFGSQQRERGPLHRHEAKRRPPGTRAGAVSGRYGPHFTAACGKWGTGHTVPDFILIILASPVRGRRGAARAVRPVDHGAYPPRPSDLKIMSGRSRRVENRGVKKPFLRRLCLRVAKNAPLSTLLRAVGVYVYIRSLRRERSGRKVVPAARGYRRVGVDEHHAVSRRTVRDGSPVQSLSKAPKALQSSSKALPKLKSRK